MALLSTDTQIVSTFAALGRSADSLRFADAGTLALKLKGLASAARNRGATTFSADQQITRLYATAAIEMWQRATHTFIVSCGLLSTSPLWSAVSGYYASHYVFRAYAHLLGYFLLYTQKELIALRLENGRFHCELVSKKSSDREHKVYWKLVRDSAAFGSDPFLDVDPNLTPISDSAHRNKANYWDHIGKFSTFDSLTIAAIIERIERISEVELNAVPIPNADEYPDLDDVHAIACHRIIGFRTYLDNLLGSKNSVWNTHRNPNWCREVMNFQVTPPRFLPERA